MIGCRLAGNMMMNRIIPVHLPYVVGLSDLVAFYRESWTAAGRLLTARRHRAATTPK